MAFPEPAVPAPVTAIEGRMQRWLEHERGIPERRRLAHADHARLLVSRFETGFAAKVGEVLMRVGLLDDGEDLIVAAYDTRAGLEPGSLRVDVWCAATSEVARDRAQALGLGEEDADLLVAGIESVAAVLNAVLWSGPLAGEAYVPEGSEGDAYREALIGADPASGLFTRQYGTFEGRAVVSHCPGAPYARVLLAAAWRACTGTAPPA